MDRKSIVFKTSIVNTLNVAIAVLIGFVRRKALLISLGTDILAINSIFGDLLALLSLSEFGFQTAIVYRLYEPIHNSDYVTINGLMNMLRKIYRIIGISIIALGVAVSPLLSYVIKGVEYSDAQIITFFILYVLTNSATYFLAYKRVFLIANQEMYKIKFFDMVGNLFFNIVNVFLLYKYKNFYLFLLINLFSNLVTNTVVNSYFDKNYKWHDNNIVPRQIDKDNIISDTKNVFLSKISGFIFNSTDSILISVIINTQLVAFYSNYNTIFVSIHGFVANAVSSMYNMFGKILQEDSADKINKILNNYTFVRFALSHVFLSTTLILSTSFVRSYYGEQFVIDDKYIFLLGISNYFLIIFTPISELTNAAGLFKIDKTIQVIMSLVNIVLSVLLARTIGLSGIILGTIIGCLVGFVIRCCQAFKNILHDAGKLRNEYFIKNTIYFIFLISFSCLMMRIVKSFIIDSIIKFCIAGIACCAISSLSLVVFCWTSEYKYALYLLLSFKEKIAGRIKLL